MWCVEVSSVEVRIMSEIEKASKILKMTPQTLRLFIREGKFGVAVKGTGSHYIYKVDWEAIRKYGQHQEDHKDSREVAEATE